MIEIVIGMVVIGYLVFWVYTMFRIIDVDLLSSSAKLGLVLSLLFLQPIGILAFWIYQLSSNEKKIENLGPID